MRPKGIIETKPRETLRRIRLTRAIPKSDNLYQAGQKSGYSKKSRQMYSKSTKAYIKKFLELTGNELEKCKERFNILIDMNLKTNDLKEVRANNENLTRMQGGFKDVRDINVTDKTDKEISILDKYRNRFTDKTEIEPITLGNTAQVCIDDNGMTKDMKDVSGLDPEVDTDNSPQSSEDSP